MLLPFNHHPVLRQLATTVLFASLWLATSFTYATNKGGVPLSQYNALVALYQATGGPHWVTSDNWLSNQPVETWFGVTVENGKVTGLALSSNNLVGKLPTKGLPLTNLLVDNNQLTGIGPLPGSLVTLDVSANLLKKLPALSPTKLQFLNASSNQLQELPGLPTTLTSLAVDFNQICLLPTLPAGLQGLSGANNNLRSLPTLPVGLFNIDVSFNKLKKLPTLPHSLTELLATNNQLEKLPVLPSMLNSLHVDFNQLYFLPKLPAALFSFSCANNHLRFSHLERIFGVFTFGAQQYAPQKDVGTVDNVTIPFGGSRTLSADFVGNSPNNLFVWFKDGVAVSGPLATPFFPITNADASKAGVYTCSITNTVVVGLTINRRPITVAVGAAPVAVNTAARLSTESAENAETGGLALKVYPNPFVHSVQLARLDERNGTVAVQVLDVQGRTVHSVEAHTIGEFIQLAQLSDGLYILRVVDGKQVKTFRLVKK